MAPDWSNIKYFRPSEFQCHCGCGRNEIKAEIVEILDAVRADVGFPLVISSGYRCPKHNSEVSKTGEHGPHTTGLAADILVVSGADGYHILKSGIASGATGIGIRKGMIHLDCLRYRDGFPRPMLWDYT